MTAVCAVLAVNFPVRSVNENMHASLAFKLALDTPGLNIFEKFTQEEYELVRPHRREQLGAGWGSSAEVHLVQQGRVLLAELLPRPPHTVYIVINPGSISVGNATLVVANVLTVTNSPIYYLCVNTHAPRS
jgi:hypothetical protein